MLDFSLASSKKPEELLALLESAAEGIETKVAEGRLAERGPNSLPDRRPPLWRIALRQFQSSFAYLLAVAALISLFLREYLDAALIAGFLAINALLGFFQEYHAERSLRLLKGFVQHKVTLLRDGHPEMVPVESVVEGDVVLLRAGDVIPADGYFLFAEGVSVDESPLTGESAPVVKTAGALPHEAKTYYEARNIGFGRTTLMSGEATLVVFATGTRSAVGSIVSAIAVTDGTSAFELGINRFSSFVLKLAFFTTALVFVIQFLAHGRDFAFSEFLLFSIALMVSVVPEALPLVTTLSLTRGAVALAKRHVVPRRLSAVEDLGSIQVLCTDKTGTITENRLEVRKIFGNRDMVLQECFLASSISPEKSGGKSVFDEALRGLAPQSLLHAFHAREVLDILPFDPERRRENVLIAGKKSHLLYARGAPESVLKVSKKKTKGELAKIEEWVGERGRSGERVLAIARKALPPNVSRIRARDERQLEFVGMVSFHDPLKPTAKRAIQDARELGVQVKIVTGDSREVAGWVAYEAGIIEHPERVMTGEEFDALSPEEKRRAAAEHHVFARTLPLQKYEIIGLLKERFLVGFLGEGFNDAPALKLAHVAIAVDGASDLARESSDIVLLNKSLEVIVDGIREGRKVFANTIKYIKATLTSNFGNFYALAFASLVIDYLPMLPVQILLLNLLSDFPMISISADRVDREELRRPRGYNVREVALFALVLGLVSTVFDFAFFGLFVRYGETNLQTLWFIGSVLTELALLFSIRTSKWFFRASRPSWTVISLTLLMGGAALLIPLSRKGAEFFSFGAPSPGLLLAALGLVAAYFVTTELVKKWFYHATTNSNHDNHSA